MRLDYLRKERLDYAELVLLPADIDKYIDAEDFYLSNLLETLFERVRYWYSAQTSVNQKKSTQLFW